MRLLITVLLVLVPLVLSLRTRRAPGDESPITVRNTGFESTAASTLNDDEVSTPSSSMLDEPSSTITTSPFVWTQTTTTIPDPSTQPPEHFPHTPSITSTDPSTTTRMLSWYDRCVLHISSSEECGRQLSKFGADTRLSPFLRADPIPPSLVGLHLALVTKDTPTLTTSDTPPITTEDPEEPSFIEVPLYRDSSLPFLPVINDTPRPTTSEKPTITMQTTMGYKPEPTKATILQPTTSLHLPQVTNNLVSSTTPIPTTPHPPQPEPTRPTTNRSPFHDACLTISTDQDGNPSRGASVLCVLNIANYYGQVHYHQTMHNNYKV